MTREETLRRVDAMIDRMIPMGNMIDAEFAAACADMKAIIDAAKE